MGQKKLKILFLMKTMRFDGGVETSVASLANAVSALGHDVFIGAFCDPSDNYLKHRLDIKKNNFLYLGKRGGLLSRIRQTYLIARFLRRNDIPILHTHLFHAGLVGRIAAKLSGSKTIHTEHSTFFHWWKGRHYAVDKFLARRTDALIAVSRSVAATLASRTAVYPDKIHIISNIVDASRFYESDVYENRSGIYLTGRLEYSKNIAFALEIQKELIKLQSSLRLNIVGNGSLRGSLREEIKDNQLEDYVRLLKPDSDFLKLLRQAKILLVTSHWEGLPMVVLEAYAAGTPVAGTSVPGVMDVIHNEHTGLLLDPTDPCEAAARLESLAMCSEYQSRLVTNAGKEVKRYESKIIGKEYEDLCLGLLKS